MRILWVTGDDDYAAVDFETDWIVEKAYDEIKQGKNIDGDNYRVELIDFADVDQRFVEFVQREIQDYDDSKHKNFYVVEPS